MTMARYVPWGLPLEPDGIRVSALCRYLGIRRDRMTHLLRRLGISTVYEAPQERRRNARGQFMLIAEDDAARVIVHVRAREGEKALRARGSAAAPESSQR